MDFPTAYIYALYIFMLCTFYFDDMLQTLCTSYFDDDNNKCNGVQIYRGPNFSRLGHNYFAVKYVPRRGPYFFEKYGPPGT